MTQLEHILEALREGHTTSTEISVATGLAPNKVSSYLFTLRERGRVQLVGSEKPAICDHCGNVKAGKSLFVYRLVDAKAVA